VKVNQAAFDCGQLAERMAQGYLSHFAAISIAADERSKCLIPPVERGQLVPVGYVHRKDGTFHAFHYEYFLNLSRVNQEISADFERTWLAGALLKVGDAISLNGYFDRAPELELLRHLRNGIAHGNRFRLDNPANLQKFPAHNKLAWVRSETKAEFEITEQLQNKEVLFDFIGPGDVLDLLMSVGLYLVRMGNGDSLRP
jgi:hypothetical protein